MATEAEAAREARAKVRERGYITQKDFLTMYSFVQVIAAEGEQKASKALKEASMVIAESSSALQLRYLQVNIVYALHKIVLSPFFRDCTIYLET